jgi:hypothetical protein
VTPKIPELGNKTRIFHDPPGEVLIVVGVIMAIFPRAGDGIAPLIFINRISKEHRWYGASVANWKVDFKRKKWPREKQSAKQRLPAKHRLPTPLFLLYFNCQDIRDLQIRCVQFENECKQKDGTIERMFSIFSLHDFFHVFGVRTKAVEKLMQSMSERLLKTKEQT